jgi:hypothetical protein
MLVKGVSPRSEFEPITSQIRIGGFTAVATHLVLFASVNTNTLGPPVLDSI